MKYLDFPFIKVYYKHADTKRVYKYFTSYISYLHTLRRAMMDARENAYVLWFDELHRKDVALVGGKSSSLGELTTSTGVPVPYGYATTAHA